jgi:hypothetical protein
MAAPFQIRNQRLVCRPDAMLGQGRHALFGQAHFGPDQQIGLHWFKNHALMRAGNR